jgi:putative flavoprotein involved in K+ transport
MLRFARRHQPRGVGRGLGDRIDHSWIDVPGVLREGRVLHTRGVTEVPGLYFLGLPWQHTRGSALLGFVADDAAHGARTATAMNNGEVLRPPGAPDA